MRVPLSYATAFEGFQHFIWATAFEGYQHHASMTTAAAAARQKRRRPKGPRHARRRVRGHVQMCMDVGMLQRLRGWIDRTSIWGADSAGRRIEAKGFAGCVLLRMLRENANLERRQGTAPVEPHFPLILAPTFKSLSPSF